MDRQQLRKGIIFFSFILFPITVYYFSPVLIVSGAAEGIITGSFIVFILMFLSALVLGRAWCGWLCPAGGLQEGCRMVNNRRAAGGSYNFIKYLFWAPWIGVILYLFTKVGGIKGVQPFYETVSGFSVADLRGLIIYTIVVVVILLMAYFLGRRAFCHYLCWMSPFMFLGSKVGRALSIPTLALKGDVKTCINCKKCDQVCPMSLDVHQMVTENDFRDPECILCGSCIDSCPKQTIRYGIKR